MQRLRQWTSWSRCVSFCDDFLRLSSVSDNRVRTASSLALRTGNISGIVNADYLHIIREGGRDDCYTYYSDGTIYTDQQ